MGKAILITGGAGFIGVNAADTFARKDWQVTVLDNLSRVGTDGNLAWLRTRVPSLAFERIDVRHHEAIAAFFKTHHFDVVLHLAAQVAVTTSVTSPREDFDINALGTFNILEGLRLYNPEAQLIYASTNKVYGKMSNVAVSERNGRYEYENLIEGVAEDQPLDFYSPYGCSKGSADQYVLDYSRIYGLRTTAFRQSCIYGTRQFGVEDQGWVAWFTIASMLDRPITIYGDGKQIRDVLWVDDLVAAYEAAIENAAAANGQAFNIGGGPSKTLSLLELIAMLEEKLGRKIPLRFDEWRPGDQPVFICNLEKAKRLLRWEPSVDPIAGVGQLSTWVGANRALF